MFKCAGKCPDLQVDIQKLDFPKDYVVLAVDMCLKGKHCLKSLCVCVGCCSSSFSSSCVSLFFCFSFASVFLFPSSNLSHETMKSPLFLGQRSHQTKKTTFLKTSKNGLEIGVSGFFCGFDPAIYIYIHTVYHVHIQYIMYIYSISCTYTVYHVQIHSWIGP